MKEVKTPPKLCVFDFKIIPRQEGYTDIFTHSPEVWEKVPVETQRLLLERARGEVNPALGKHCLQIYYDTKEGEIIESVSGQRVHLGWDRCQPIDEAYRDFHRIRIVDEDNTGNK